MSEDIGVFGFDGIIKHGEDFPLMLATPWVNVVCCRVSIPLMHTFATVGINTKP